jgi:murein DD-endopeptidase MepM/ murein hydrolase activator NlpD
MKNRRLWISILAGVMALVLLLTLIVGILPRDASATTSSELKDQLDELQSQKDELANKIAELEKQQSNNLHDMQGIIAQKDVIDQQVALLHAEVSNVNTQIAAYSLLIADKQKELDEATKRLEELNEKNKERIRAMEEGGSLSYWSVLFKANSFSDLLDRLNMMQEIAASDRRRLEEMSKAAEVVAQAQAELTAEKKALEQTRAALEVTQQELAAKDAEADKLLQDLLSLSEDMEKLHNQFEKEEEDFLDEIAKKEQEYNDKLDEEASIAASIKASIEASILESIWIKESIEASIEESRRQEALDESRRQEALEESRREEDNKKPNQGGSIGSTDNPSGVRWLVPCDYIRVTSPFGYRWHPTTGEWSMHKGVDFGAYKGTPIYASRSGKVTTATYSSTAGNYVGINHQDGYSSIYMHMTHYVVGKGEYVKAGQLIGYVGSTGRSTGPHLHFGISYNGTYVNPMDYLP